MSIRLLRPLTVVLPPGCVIRLADDEEATLETKGIGQRVEDVQAEYLSIKGVAQLTALSSKHIRRAVVSGELPSVPAGSAGSGRPTYRIARTDVDRWLESKRPRQGRARAERDALVERFYPKRRA